MSKVTSKLQVTLPKSLADLYGIRPGDEIEWQEAGEVIRVVPVRKGRKPRLDPKARLKLFDQATSRQREREAGLDPSDLEASAAGGRGWTREDLYGHGGAR